MGDYYCDKRSGDNKCIRFRDHDHKCIFEVPQCGWCATGQHNKCQGGSHMHPCECGRKLDHTGIGFGQAQFSPAEWKKLCKAVDDGLRINLYRRRR